MSVGVTPAVGLPMTNHPIPHRHRGTRAARSSRPHTGRQEPLVLRPACYVERDEAQEQAALAALADLLVPHLDQPEEKEEDA